MGNDATRNKLGLFRRRLCLVPTWRGWLVLLLAFLLLGMLAVRSLYPFLALNQPLPDGVLVVEGWGSDRAMEAAAAEFRSRQHDKIYVIGGPMERGGYLSGYGTFAELGTATLLRLGLSTNQVQSVPAPAVLQDRTYAAGVALHKWWDAHGMTPTRVHLVSEGPHARRSRLLFEKALGKGVTVGVTSVPGVEYDPKHWWRTSPGVRTVIGEAIAYSYVRFLFRAPKEAQ